MPGPDKQGVYALLNKGGNVICVGVGAAFGVRIYDGCELGARTVRYTGVPPDRRTAIDALNVAPPSAIEPL